MKIVENPSIEWSKRITCKHCKTIYEADQDDVQVDGFKTSGYFFAGTAVLETRFFVQCPTDNFIFVVPNDDLPMVLRDQVRAVENAKRKTYEGKV